MSTNRLNAPTRRFVGGNAVFAVGTGLVLPLTLIYLHEVRSIPLAVVGGLLAMSSAVGVVGVPLVGALLDRVGPRRVLIAVLAGQAVAEAGLAWTHNVLTAIPTLLLLGACLGPFFPSLTTMLAALNPAAAAQQRAFAVNFTATNAGIGIGGAIGAAVADVAHPGSFQLLFLANAASCLAFAALLLLRLPAVRPTHRTETARAGYRDVLADRGLRTVILATLVLAFTGYAALDSGLPAYATVEGHVSVHVVALSLTVNTAVIVGAQLLVLRLVRRLRRSRALAVVGLIWAVSWAVFGLAGLSAPIGVRMGFVLGFAALFGLGETFMAPTVSPLVNALADDRTRGRANALSSWSYSVAFVVSPAISTGLIAAGLPALWIGLLCAGCLGTVALGSRLGRVLPPERDRVEPAVEPVPPVEPLPV